jgi:hypothetical protein
VGNEEAPLLGMMEHLEGQKQLTLLRYNSKTPTTVSVVDNILLSKRLIGTTINY